MKRWLVEVVYRSECGPMTVLHAVEELSEIEELVERGPDWNTIDHVMIRLQRTGTPGMTLEQDESFKGRSISIGGVQ